MAGHRIGMDPAARTEYSGKEQIIEEILNDIKVPFVGEESR